MRDRLFILITALLLGAPLAFIGTAGLAAPSSFENRLPASAPQWTKAGLPRWIKDFERYFKDRFPLRNELLLGNTLLRYFVLRTSTSPQVFNGKQGWLFYREKPNFDQVLERKPFSEPELRGWVDTFRRRTEWSERRGAKYLFVVIPDTHSVYPEFLPTELKPGNPSRLSQLQAAISQYNLSRCETCPEVSFVSLLPELLQAKNELPDLYYATDTHWNGLGAYVGYRHILIRLANLLPEFAQALAPTPLQDFTQSATEVSGDLTGMLGLKGILSEQDIEFIPNTPRRAIVDSTQRSSQANFVTLNKTTGPKAVAFRDSFTVALQPLLSEHFSSIRYVWTQEFERKWIDRDRPDIVLQLFTERFLYSYRVKPAEHGDR